MSDYHIRQCSDDYKEARVVFHFPIPEGTNAVGETWRDALVYYLGGPAAIETVLAEGVPAEDEAAMAAGELYEIPRVVRFSSVNLNGAQRLAEVVAAYSALASQEWPKIQARLQYFGHEGDV